MTRVGTTRIPAFSGGRLRTAREATGWAQGRLAVQVGATLTSISAWERGTRTPEPKTFLALAKALHIAPADLLDLPVEQWTLVEYRVVAGLHQRDAAAQLGIPTARISNFESGYDRPAEDIAQALANAYGASPQQINAAWERGREELLRH